MLPSSHVAYITDPNAHLKYDVQSFHWGYMGMLDRNIGYVTELSLQDFWHPRRAADDVSFKAPTFTGFFWCAWSEGPPVNDKFLFLRKFHGLKALS